MLNLWCSFCLERHWRPTVQPPCPCAALAGASCAMAILLPNVEFVFGLAGSTASVLLSFILPAAIFLRTTGAQRGLLGAGVDMLHGSPLWRQRRRMAGALLLFGLAAGLMCTHALVASIQEEAEVVQLARELVREEARVVRAAEAELKAKQVAQTVGAVSEVAKELSSANQQAAATLGAVATVAADLQATRAQAAQAAQAGSAAAAGRQAARQQTKAAAQAGLKQVQGEVDKTLAALQAITDTLGTTAARLRNGTLTAAAANATTTALLGGAARQQVQKRQQQQQQPGMQQPGSTLASSGSGGDNNVASQAEAAAQHALAQLAGADASKHELREVAAALTHAQTFTNETLARVRGAKTALERAQRIKGDAKVRDEG